MRVPDLVGKKEDKLTVGSGTYSRDMFHLFNERSGRTIKEAPKGKHFPSS